MVKGPRRKVGQRSKVGEEPLLDRPLIWMGRSKDDISAMPDPMKASFGYRLRRIQQGKPTDDTKALRQFGNGVYELREAYDTNAYRVVHVVSLKKAVYVLHAFMKKSKSGIALPRSDANVIQARLKQARTVDAESDDD